MNIYIQIILFISIPLLIFYVFYLIKLNTKVEKENIKFEAEVPNIIAESARGSARDCGGREQNFESKTFSTNRRFIKNSSGNKHEY